MPLKNYLIKLDGRSICQNGAPHLIKDACGEYCFEMLSFMPKGIRYFPSFAAKIITDGGTLSYVSDCFCVCSFGRKIYEINVLPHILYSHSREETTCVHEYFSGGKKYKARIVRDSQKTLYAESSGEKFCAEPLPDGIERERIDGFVPDGGGYLLSVSGEIENQKYIMILRILGNTYDIILERIADAVVYENGNLTLTTSFTDMLRRRRTEKYSLKYGAVSEEKTEYSYGDNLSYGDEFIPYLFLEAIGANDGECAKKYLHADLKDNISEIREYFGSFCSVEYPVYFEPESSITALKYRKGKDAEVRYFEFFTQDGLITNFTETEL
jgi:hypothetical protein